MLISIVRQSGVIVGKTGETRSDGVTQQAERQGIIYFTMGRNPMTEFKFDVSRRTGHEVAEKVSANEEASASMHEAINKRDTVAVVNILQKHGLFDIKPEQIILTNWIEAVASRGNPTQSPNLKCRKWVYWLEPTFDLWGGIGWRVVEGCAAYEGEAPDFPE